MVEIRGELNVEFVEQHSTPRKSHRVPHEALISGSHSGIRHALLEKGPAHLVEVHTPFFEC